MPCLLQWRGSSVNVRQSARATHPGMHMPSGRRAHRGLHIYHGESVARAMLPARLIIVSRHAATPRKIAWSCHPPPPSTSSSHAAKASVSTNPKPRQCHSGKRIASGTGFRFIFEHRWKPPFDSVDQNLQQRPTTDVVGEVETWGLKWT